MSTILLTGIPRSGTTLACHVLNLNHQTVALHEPLSPTQLQGTPNQVVRLILSQLESMRRDLLETGHAISKQADGKIPMNPVALTTGRRKEVVELGRISVDKSLSENFCLIVKHNALFTALSPLLESQLPLFALVRNPLPVLASWQSVELPVAKGTIPMGERFDPILSKNLRKETDVLAKQLIILSWFFERYRQFEETRIISYESMIKTDGACLTAITETKFAVTDLEEQLTNSRVSERMLEKLFLTLLDYPEIYEPFYSAEDLQVKYLEMLR